MKIPCGGFFIDEETLEINDNTLSVKNSGGGGSVFSIEDPDGTLDKTWQEILDAVANRQICIITIDNGGDSYNVNFVSDIYEDSGNYIIVTTVNGRYSTNSADGYPEFVIG